MYRVVLIIEPAAARELAKLPRADRERVREALEQVAAAPSVRLSFVTEMAGRPGHWRLRKGNWRAIYRVDGEDVVVLRVAHRREAYR